MEFRGSGSGKKARNRQRKTHSLSFEGEEDGSSMNAVPMKINKLARRMNTLSFASEEGDNANGLQRNISMKRMQNTAAVASGAVSESSNNTYDANFLEKLKKENYGGAIGVKFTSELDIEEIKLKRRTEREKVQQSRSKITEMNNDEEKGRKERFMEEDENDVSIDPIDGSRMDRKVHFKEIEDTGTPGDSLVNMEVEDGWGSQQMRQSGVVGTSFGDLVAQARLNPQEIERRLGDYIHSLRTTYVDMEATFNSHTGEMERCKNRIAILDEEIGKNSEELSDELIGHLDYFSLLKSFANDLTSMIRVKTPLLESFEENHPKSRTASLGESKEVSSTVIESILGDVDPTFLLPSVVGRFVDFQNRYPAEFEQTHSAELLPAILLFFARVELLEWDPLSPEAVNIGSMDWKLALSPLGRTILADLVHRLVVDVVVGRIQFAIEHRLDVANPLDVDTVLGRIHQCREACGEFGKELSAQSLEDVGRCANSLVNALESKVRTERKESERLAEIETEFVEKKRFLLRAESIKESEEKLKKISTIRGFTANITW